ncbi:MAG TPA: plastocyanin/azurin family copper-binding protein [Gemmatimonadales bacterium]|nr:plastocyanin/azurin family copper-binding protein [Gemmatimonadales bacterium]
MMSRYSAGSVLAMGWLIALGAWGCGDDGPNQTVAVIKAPRESGDAQTGPAGETLINPLRVLVTTDGNPKAGAAVTWFTDDGLLEPTSDTTGADGISATSWSLGDAEGTQTARATVSGTGDTITFTATATVTDGGPPPADPVSIAVTVGNNSFTSDRNESSNPAVDTLAIGGTVTWSWGPGAGSHSVRSNQTPGAPTFASSVVKTGSGQSYAVTFTEAGTYTYDCSIHGAAMTGRVVVR